jgi:dTDP-4-amino-4,6-dideoxygalactose transaminase
MEALAPHADNDRLRLPTVPPWVETNHHIFYVLFRDEPTRNRALTFFRDRGVGTTFHYLPLHLSKVGLELGYRAGDFPVTESASGRLMRLPIYPALTAEEQERVITTMKEFLAS